MKAKITKIELERAEGPNDSDFSRKTYQTLEQADAALVEMGRTAPEKGHGYDKTDFWVTWDDGEVYEGRFDLQQGGRESGGETLREHILNFLKFYAGEFRPSHLSEAKYKAFLAHNGEATAKEARQFLATREI